MSAKTQGCTTRKSRIDELISRLLEAGIGIEYVDKADAERVFGGDYCACLTKSISTSKYTIYLVYGHDGSAGALIQAVQEISRLEQLHD